MMEKFERCKNCGSYAFLDGHKCPPEWEACESCDEDDIKRVFGCDAKSAAEKCLEENFSNWDYPEEMEIWITSPSYQTTKSLPLTIAMRIMKKRGWHLAPVKPI